MTKLSSSANAWAFFKTFSYASSSLIKWSEGVTKTTSFLSSAKQAKAMAGAVFLPIGSSRNFDFLSLKERLSSLWSSAKKYCSVFDTIKFLSQNFALRSRVS